MENHQRTMELIEVATDSTGRANEQFAKYADTIEYKVNKIKNSWEELRVSLMNRGVFNGLLDIVDGALQRMKTMDIKDFGVLTAWALTVGKSLVNGIIEGISNRGNQIRRAIASTITKQKYSIELQAEIDSASYSKIKGLNASRDTHRLKSAQAGAEASFYSSSLETTYNSIPEVQKLNQLYEERRQLHLDILNAKSQEKQDEALINNLNDRLLDNDSKRVALEQKIENSNITNRDIIIDINNHRNEALNTEYRETEILRQQTAEYERQRNLLKTKWMQGFGTAMSQAATTAISMALTGSFKASEIAKTTLITSLTGAVGSALQGQWQLAIAQASIAAIARVAQALLEWHEKIQEEEKLENDRVYRIKKQREGLVEVQEEYNKKLDETNSKYNDAKEKWDSINKASEEYLELSSKGLLDEEETSSLEESIDTLTELVPELVEGYNAEGEAVLAIGDKYNNLISQYEKAEQQARALQKQAEATANALGLVDQYLNSQEDLKMAKEYEAYAKEVQNGKTWRITDDSMQVAISRDYSLDEILSTSTYNSGFGKGDATGSRWLYQVFKDTSSSGEAQRQLIIDVLKDIEGVSGLSEKSTYKEIDAILDDGEKGSRIWRDFAKEYKKRLEDIGKTVEELIEESEATKAGITRQLPNLRASTLDAIVANLETEGMDETSLNYYKDFLSKQIITSDQLKSIVEEAFSGNRSPDQASKYVEDELKKLENSVAQNGVNEKYTKFFSNLTDTQKELIGTYYDNISQLSTSENKSAAEELIKALGIDDEQIQEYFLNAAEGSKANIEEMYRSFITNLDAAGRTVPKQLKSYFYQMGEESVAGFKDAIVNISKDPEEQASLIESFVELIRRGFSPEALTTALNSIDWSSVTIFSEEDFLTVLERDLSQFNLNGAELKQIYNAFSEPFLASGMESIDYSSAIDSLSTKYIDKLQKNGSDLAEYFEDNVESIALEGKELKQVQKALENTGASAEAFLDTTNGGTIFNVKAAREYYNAQTKNAEKLERQLELDIQSGKLTEQEIKDKKEELKTLRQEEQVTRSILGLEQSIDTILSKQTEKISSSINAYKNMMSNFYSTGAIDSSSFTSWAKSMLELDSSIDLNQFFNGTNFNTSAYQNYIKTQIADLESKKNLNIAQKEQLVNLRSLNWQLEEANTELQKQALEDNEIVKAQKEVEEAHKKVADALNDIAKAEQNVIDKQNELNETMYGSSNFKSQLEPMYNYSTLNQRYADLAARAKNILDNPDIDDNTREALQDYLANNRKQLLNYLAQNEVYGAAAQTDLTSLYEGLPQRLQGLNEKFGANYDTNVKQYFKIIDGVLTADIEALNRAALPDDIKNEIATLAESYNTNSDNILKNNDNIKKLLKEREEIHKANLQAEVSIQEKVAEVLKEKYQEQVENLKDKYDAMKEADNEYLEALQDSIDKQRKLRERENKWEDLAQKRKKLSLQQRDTSGANQLSNQKLEKEIQKDEQSLLDSSIDDIVNNLKEFYELQDETRQDEVEYQEALKDNTNWIAEANKIVLGLGTAEDFINWMKENSEDWQNMTAQQIELEEIELTEMFQKHQEYMEEQEEQILNSLNITEEEVQRVIDETSEALIRESERSLNEITEKVDDSIETAKTALVDAMTALSEKQAAYLDALTEEGKKIGNLQIAYNIVNQYAEHLRDLLQEFSSASYEAYGRQAELEAMEAAERARSYIDAEQYGQHYSNSQHEVEKVVPDNVINAVDRILMSDSMEEGYSVAQSYYRGNHPIISREIIAGSGLSTSEIAEELKRRDYHGYYSDSAIYLGDDINTRKTAEGRGLPTFATGGLVNYTGPAWVDGTPTKPEAFLSADDTQNIAAMTNVLSSLRDLLDFTTYSQSSTINNTNRNDTTINITVNVDNIADDYDVDLAIERIKQDIVDAASYAGSNVILNT